MKKLIKSLLNFLKTIFLSPLSFLWEKIYELRRFFYQYGYFSKSEFAVPIISVGNIAFGGTGKTPLTIWLANYFTSIGKRPLILMRGYKGKLENSFGVLEHQDNNADPQSFGDEATMMAKKISDGVIVVGKNRSKNLSFYLRKYNPDVVLLDDGHQHLKIKRNMNIVTIDSSMPLSRYKTAPLGYLREGPKSLLHADVMLLGRTDLVEKAQLEKLKSFLRQYTTPKTLFVDMDYKIEGFYNHRHEKVYDLDDLSGQDIVAATAVASPDSFFQMLKKNKLKVIDEKSFPDHYFFTDKDIKNLFSKKEDKGKQKLVVVTEKDMVKMKDFYQGEDLLYLKVNINIKNNENVLKKTLEQSAIM